MPELLSKSDENLTLTLLNHIKKGEHREIETLLQTLCRTKPDSKERVYKGMYYGTVLGWNCLHYTAFMGEKKAMKEIAKVLYTLHCMLIGE